MHRVESNNITLYVRTDTGDNDTLLVEYMWVLTVEDVKKAIEDWLENEYGFKYFIDYTINITSGIRNVKSGTSMIMLHFRDPESFVMLKLTL